MNRYFSHHFSNDFALLSASSSFAQFVEYQYSSKANLRPNKNFTASEAAPDGYDIAIRNWLNVHGARAIIKP